MSLQCVEQRKSCWRGFCRIGHRVGAPIRGPKRRSSCEALVAVLVTPQARYLLSNGHLACVGDHGNAQRALPNRLHKYLPGWLDRCNRLSCLVLTCRSPDQPSCWLTWPIPLLEQLPQELLVPCGHCIPNLAQHKYRCSFLYRHAFRLLAGLLHCAAQPLWASNKRVHGQDQQIASTCVYTAQLWSPTHPCSWVQEPLTQCHCRPPS